MPFMNEPDTRDTTPDDPFISYVGDPAEPSLFRQFAWGVQDGLTAVFNFVCVIFIPVVIGVFAFMLGLALYTWGHDSGVVETKRVCSSEPIRTSEVVGDLFVCTEEGFGR